MAPLKKTSARIFHRIIACFIPWKEARHAYRRKYKSVRKKWRWEEEYKHVKQAWIERLASPLLPARFAEYDLVFAIGGDCMMTEILSGHELRLFSNPFDWTAGMAPADWNVMPNVWRDTRFKEKIDILCNDFRDYFNPDDLMPYSIQIGPGMKHIPVVNIRNKIRFFHLFDADKSMESQMSDVCAKISRRARRLIEEISNSNRILICWGHRMANHLQYLDAPVSDDDIKYAVDKLRRRWPDGEFDFVFFEHDGTKGRFEFDKIKVCDGAYRIRSNHFICEPAYRRIALGVNYRYPHLVVAEALDNVHLSCTQNKVDNGAREQ